MLNHFEAYFGLWYFGPKFDTFLTKICIFTVKLRAVPPKLRQEILYRDLLIPLFALLTICDDDNPHVVSGRGKILHKVSKLAP